MAAIRRTSKSQAQQRDPRGLTQSEAEARLAQGQGNTLDAGTSRTYGQIARDSIFTFYNNILFVLGAVLVVLGRWQDAVVAVGVVLINAVVGVVQEVRAKATLDHIALLTRPKATVIRDGQPREITPDAVVQGDLLSISAGDQFVADGHVIGAGHVDVDESLLTGESDLIPKGTGDAVSSGTFCVSGQAQYLAERVGANSTANRLAASARAFRSQLTPLQRDINLIIQVLLLVAIFIELLIAGSAVFHGVSFVNFIRRSVVISSIIPVGLFLSITVAYALGAVRLAQKQVLVQQQNAIEALSHIDVLCLDKTGTLTTGRMQMGDIVPLGITQDDLTQRIGAFAASGASHNKTSATVAAAYPAAAVTVLSEVPFSSARKWSALVCDAAPLHGTYVLGALEMLAPSLSAEDQVTLQGTVNDHAATGLRVLIFTMAAALDPLGQAEADYHLPPRLTSLGILTLSDELRPEAAATLTAFAKVGVGIKIISGDSPQTVFALAQQAGIPQDARLISGPELAAMDDAAFTQAAEGATIFGRITPEQKERLVHALRAGGHHIAMTGDGVNDVLALKAADVGIAMQSGSPATRSVADIVLLQDSFAPLPLGLNEGQRIYNGMENIIKLFLTRTLFVIVTLIAVSMITESFAFTPKTNSLLALLAGGIPALALAVWTQPGVSQGRSIFGALLHFTLPAGLAMALIGILVFISIYALPGDTSARAQTALTLFGTACTVLLLVFIAPPVTIAPALPASEDRRPLYLAVGLLVALVFIALVPLTRRFFDLAVLDGAQTLLVLGGVAAWTFITYQLWRRQVLERFLRL